MKKQVLELGVHETIFWCRTGKTLQHQRSGGNWVQARHPSVMDASFWLCLDAMNHTMFAWTTAMFSTLGMGWMLALAPLFS